MKIDVSHILVKHEHEAQDMLRKLSEGESFGKLAQVFSQCPSQKQAGHLGEIESSRLVHEFAEVAEKLNPGQISGIVKTQFGYHIILRH